MSVRRFEDMTPNVDPTAWVDATALVLGDVTIGADCSVWPGSVIRGDVQSIRIGQRTSVQDGSVIHVTHDSEYCPGGLATEIGDDVTIGHRAVLHACRVANQVLIGMGALILDGARLEARCMVAAGALVPPGQTVESGWLYVGSPARKQRRLTERELGFLVYSAANYVKLKDRHAGRRRD